MKKNQIVASLVLGSFVSSIIWVIAANHLGPTVIKSLGYAGIIVGGILGIVLGVAAFCFLCQSLCWSWDQLMTKNVRPRRYFESEFGYHKRVVNNTLNTDEDPYKD